MIELEREGSKYNIDRETIASMDISTEVYKDLKQEARN